MILIEDVSIIEDISIKKEWNWFVETKQKQTDHRLINGNFYFCHVEIEY